MDAATSEFVSTAQHWVRTSAETSAALIELIGVVLIAVAAVLTLVVGLWQLARREDQAEIFRRTRHRLIRGILLGLEFLVAADIIHTVAVDLTFGSVGVLAIVVLIRTFLSFTLELEMTGRWPWQKPDGG
jgi:uncharacterized membrane protein